MAAALNMCSSLKLWCMLLLLAGEHAFDGVNRLSSSDAKASADRPRSPFHASELEYELRSNLDLSDPLSMTTEENQLNPR